MGICHGRMKVPQRQKSRVSVACQGMARRRMGSFRSRHALNARSAQEIGREHRIGLGRPRGGDGVVPRVPGAAWVRRAAEGLAVLDRPPPGARHRRRRDGVGRTSARRGGVVGVAWVGVGVVGLQPDLRCGCDGCELNGLKTPKGARKLITIESGEGTAKLPLLRTRDR